MSLTYKTYEDMVLDEGEDDLTYLAANFAQNAFYNTFKLQGPQAGIERGLFYAVMRMVYDMFPVECLAVFNYEPVDKFLFLIGPQMVFTSMYTRNNRAVISDLINIGSILLKDYATDEL